MGLCRIFLPALLAGVLPCVAHAEARDQARWADSWSVKIAPYVWGIGTEGQFAHERLPLTLRGHKSFGDTLEDLELGGMGMLEFRRGRYSLLVDGQYSRSATTLNAQRGGFELPVHLKTEHYSTLLAVGYGLHHDDGTTVDMVAGLRIWSVRVVMAYDAPSPTPAPVPQRYAGEQRQRWLDAQIGVRARHTFRSQVFLAGWVLAGAGDSRLSADAMVVVGLPLSQHISLTAGYRWLSTDYTTSKGFTFDARMHGPGIGMEYVF